MKSSKSTDSKSMNRGNISASPNHRKPIAVAASDIVVPAASTETLGRSQAGAYTTTTSEGRTKAEYCSRSGDEAPELSTWLWDVDRPWEGFKPPNLPNPEMVQNNMENNGMTSRRRKATTLPRECATEKHWQGISVGCLQGVDLQASDPTGMDNHSETNHRIRQSSKQPGSHQHSVSSDT